MQSLMLSAGGIGFIFLMTCLGSLTVFFFRNTVPDKFRQIFLGFAAGVMITASIWSLLIPAIEAAEERGLIGWIPAAIGFALGVLFLLGLDCIIPHLHLFSDKPEGPASVSKRSTLFFSAITLHNIPEGMAVGLAFALAIQHGSEPGAYAAAVALSLGIGIQNLPEGAAVSLLMRQEGASPAKAFGIACLSGVVEPFFGFLTVLLAAWIAPIMPWLLSFAAGSMMYVVVEELIPEANLGSHSNAGTISVMVGFVMMMILDVALG